MADRPVLGIGNYAGIPCLMGQFTLSHGIRPSAATVYFLRNQTLPPVGDFILDGTDEFGNEHLVPFKSCLVDNIQASAGGDPLIVVRLLDRRWAWEAGAISGHYNIRTESGDSIYNEKTPRELATLCLQVMGETDADIADFNPEGNPPIDWECVNPARALDELVNQYGYRVALGIDNRTHIFRSGEGDMSFLDRYTWLEDTVGVDLPKRYDGFIATAGRTLWNIDFWLEPVGVELNGEWKNINKLSYKPTAGWESTALPSVPRSLVYPAGASEAQKEQIKQLAVEHVYRTYRICIQKPPHWTAIDANNDLNQFYSGELRVDGYQGVVKNRWQVLPLESTQNLRDNLALKPGEKPGNTLIPRRRPAEVVGFFNSGHVATKDLATREALRGDQTLYRSYKLPFTLDTERGLVHFEAIAHCIMTDNNPNPNVVKRPAMLYLRVATGIRDEKTRAWKRHTLEYNLPNPIGAGKQVLLHDEVQLRYAPKDPDPNFIGPPAPAVPLDNKAAVEKELKYYLSAAIELQKQRAARTGSFAGILNVAPSGLIQQITWSFGSDGPKTQVSGNTEHSYYVPSYYERRLQSKLLESRAITGPAIAGAIAAASGAPV